MSSTTSTTSAEPTIAALAYAVENEREDEHGGRSIELVASGDADALLEHGSSTKTVSDVLRLEAKLRNNDFRDQFSHLLATRFHITAFAFSGARAGALRQLPATVA